MFEVNFHAPIDLAQAVIPSMRERGEGWIINISSSSSDLTPGPPPFPWSPMGTTQGAYGSSKAALNRYSNLLGIELYGTGIRINALQPIKPVASEGAVAHLQGRIPADQFNPVEVMAEAALVLGECGPELTARLCDDGPLLDELGIAVKTLDGLRVRSGFLGEGAGAGGRGLSRCRRSASRARGGAVAADHPPSRPTRNLVKFHLILGAEQAASPPCGATVERVRVARR